MKFLVLFFSIFFVSLSFIQAAITTISLDVGQVSFQENFDSNYRLGGRVSFDTDLGFVFDGSIHYIDVTSSSGDVNSFKSVPVLAGLSYKAPFKSIKPYLGILGGFSMMSSSYNSPLFTYGGKAGLMVDVSKETVLYIEYNQLYFDNDAVITIEPFQILIGLGVLFGNNNDGDVLENIEKNNRQQFKPLRKPRKRKPSPKGPGRY